MAVGQLVSTADVPERDRMAFWVEAVCETFLELKVSSTAGRKFHGTINTHEVGQLALNFMTFDDQKIVRTKESISRGKISEFYLIQPRDQQIRFSQFDREVEIVPGGCTLLDSRYPFTIQNSVDRDCLSIAIPTDWLLTWLPSPEDIVAQHWQPGRGWGGVLATALSNLNPDSVENLPLLPSVFNDQLGSMIAMAASGATTPPTCVRSKLIDRIIDTLRGAYHDPLLSPPVVAAHHGISLRYLHLQFAASGTTFGTELLKIRLEHSRRMMQDPQLARLSVGEIALRSGFSNASHFARRFRNHFGQSPTELRILCKA